MNIELLTSCFFNLLICSLLIIIYYTLSKNIENQKIAQWTVLGFSIWIIIQSILSIKKVYLSDLDILPPKLFIYGILPNILFLVIFFFNKKTKNTLDRIPIQDFIFVSIIRIPVEFTLYLLSIQKMVPEIMTFEGRNFDIIAGISAVIIYFAIFSTKRISLKVIFLWNSISLILLINIIFLAIFSTPSPFQKYGFDYPNVAVLSYPYSLLPSFIVPIVLLSHIFVFRKIYYLRNEEK